MRGKSTALIILIIWLVLNNETQAWPCHARVFFYGTPALKKEKQEV